MFGPPGAGKSMLAARLPGLLPPLEAAEILETSMIARVAGELGEGNSAARWEAASNRGRIPHE